MNAINKAIDICGGQSALAKKIGVTQPAVYKWANGLAVLSPKYCSSIEAATDGKVTKRELRPDIFGESPQ